jgi:ribosomal-protein-alanine acetyltransferase
VSASDITIRPAKAEDLDQLLIVERQCFRAHRFTRKNFHYHLKNSRSVFAVAESNGEIAGYVAGIIYHGSHNRIGRIYSMAVLPKWRGRGIGSRLLKYFEYQSEKQGSQSITLEVRKTNRTAFNLYKRAGYEVKKTLPDYYATGSDGLRMRKRLSS